MADPIAVTLHLSGAETASAQGAAVDIGATRSCVKLALVVTALAGTSPTLLVAVETAPSASGPWRQAGSFPQVNAVGKTTRTLADLDEFVRLNWTIAGTGGPSFTFSVDGLAHVLYASPSDLASTAINTVAIAGMDPAVLAECCLRATSEAETALNSSYQMPITAWGEDLRGHVAARAVYHALTSRGRKPGSDALDLMGGYRTEQGVKSATQAFFDAIAAGILKPVGIVDQTPDEFEGAGVVASGVPRAWGLGTWGWSP